MNAVCRSTAAAVQRQPCFKASLAFVPVVTVYVCVVDAQQGIEPRQHFHVQCNKSNTHRRVSYHTRYTKHTAGAKAVSYVIPGTYHWNACVHHFRLATPLGKYEVNLVSKGSLVRRMALTAREHENPFISYFHSKARPTRKLRGRPYSLLIRAGHWLGMYWQQ